MKVSLDFFFHAVHEQTNRIANHRHKCFEIVYYVRGTGHTLIGNRDYEYRAGQFAIIHPQTVHNERHDELTEVIVAGYFCSSPIPELGEGIYTDGNGQPILLFMERLADEMRQKHPYYKSMLNALLTELVVVLTRHALPGQNSEPEFKLQYAKAYIDEHFAQKIDFSALAIQSGYSYDRFRHLFKDYTGLSPTQYILHKRIEHAKKLLIRTNQQNVGIALECGFFNDAQFCSLFKREVGLTPREFRRHYLNTSGS